MTGTQPNHLHRGNYCTHSILVETVGSDLASNVVYLPSVGASGGILIAASERFFTIGQPNLTTNTVSATITMLAENKSWTITGVYGPQADTDKILFMQEITDLSHHVLPPWLILGDFNLILRVQDKNNSRINLQMLSRFRATVDNLELVPLDLRGKKFTWCNDQQVPTMTKIDHFLATDDWLNLFPRSDLQALASLGSDHCPLFLRGDVNFDFYRGFRFEAHWARMAGFLDTVKEAWNKPVNTQDAILRFHVKAPALCQSATELEAKIHRWLEINLGHHKHHLGKFRASTRIKNLNTR